MSCSVSSADKPFDDVKKRYRKLVSDNHPDRLIARGLPQEFIKIATTRIAAINAAYETDRARRCGRHERLPARRAAAPRSGYRRISGQRRTRLRPGHDRPALYGHGDRARRRKAGCAIRRAKCRRTISCTRTAASSRWCAKAIAPGMPARVRGTVGPTSTPARSASRSSIPAISLGYPDFPERQIEAVIEPCRRHRRPARHPRRSGFSPIPTWHPVARSIPGEKFPWRRLFEAGIGHLVAAVADQAAGLRC